MAVKETIDIEAMLYRAYAQHRIDRVAPSAAQQLRHRPSGSLVGSMQAVALGTSVDNSGAAARMIGMQTMLAATPDDMMIVHDHVLALAGWRIEDAHGSAPHAWRLAEFETRGWHVAETSGGLWLVRPGEGPRGTDSRARLTNPYLSVLVIEHARAGTRPDCAETSRRGRGWRSAERQAQVRDTALERALYAVWHAALGTLVADLAGRLAQHAVTGPSAPSAPWAIREGTTVHTSLSETGKKRVTSSSRKTLKEHCNFDA